MIDLTQPVVAIPDLRKQTALLPAMGAHSAVPGIYNEAYRSSASSIPCLPFTPLSCASAAMDAPMYVARSVTSAATILNSLTKTRA